MSFKRIQEIQKKMNIGLYQTELFLTMPKKYESLSEEEVRDININYIPAECGVMMLKGDKKGLLLYCLDLTKQKLDIEKFETKCKDQFWTAFNKWKEDQ